MNTVKPDPAISNDINQAWQQRKPADDLWARDIQAAALDEFMRTGFPSTRLENWKYTDVKNLAGHYGDWLQTAPDSGQGDTASGFDINDAIRICFVDGIYQPALSTATIQGAEIHAGNLSEVLSSAPAIKDTFGKLARTTDSGLVALNTAFTAGTAAVILPDQAELAMPVYLHFHTSTQNLSTQPRIVINLGNASRATVIEHHTSDQPGITNAVTEIRCSRDSELTYYRVQDEHTDAWHTSVQYADLAENARIHTTHLDTGSALARSELNLRLAGRHAEADCKGLFMADGKRHVDSRISVEHAAPDTRSRERFRSILGGTARGVFNGRIYVESEAQKTSAELTNRNLLLTKGAEINTKPELEIYADDVKCAHGSTTGQLDENSLFYLLSRGIDEHEARSILVTAFAGELLTDIGVEPITARAHEALQALRTDSQ